MEINFSKYQGAGNDFIMINGFEYDEYKSLTQHQIEILCDRRIAGLDLYVIMHELTMFWFLSLILASIGNRDGTRLPVNLW